MCVISFRSVPRVLSVFYPNGWIPHFTSVINWTLRFGLYLMGNISRIEESFIAIVDISIDVACKKVLVVLRVPLSALANRKSAITLEDTECIGVEVAETWTGETVCQALQKIFALTGLPVAIIKDGGSDLNKGVRLLNERSAKNAIHIIDDVGHVAANALKGAFAALQIFKDFIRAVYRGAAKLRQSEISFLKPPKIRSKGRFQGITVLGKWALRIIELLGNNTRAKPNSLAAKLKKFMPGLSKYRSVIEQFSNACEVVSSFLNIIKNQGLNNQTYIDAKNELNKLSPESSVYKKLNDWLDKHIKIYKLLSTKKCITMLASSDILESLYGKFKLIVARNPKAEFNRIVLAIPTLCGKNDKNTINSALNTIKQRDLEKWQKENCKSSQSQARRAFNNGELKPDMVPKPGGNRWWKSS